MSEEPRQPKSGLRPLTWWDGAWLALGLAVLIICRLLGVDVWAVLLLVIVVLFGPNIANRIDRIKRVSWGYASAEIEEELRTKMLRSGLSLAQIEAALADEDGLDDGAERMTGDHDAEADLTAENSDGS